MIVNMTITRKLYCISMNDGLVDVQYEDQLAKIIEKSGSEKFV